MTSIAGHLYSLDFEPKWKNWDSSNPIDLLNREVAKVKKEVRNACGALDLPSKSFLSDFNVYYLYSVKIKRF